MSSSTITWKSESLAYSLFYEGSSCYASSDFFPKKIDREKLVANLVRGYLCKFDESTVDELMIIAQGERLQPNILRELLPEISRISQWSDDGDLAQWLLELAPRRYLIVACSTSTPRIAHSMQISAKSISGTSSESLRTALEKTLQETKDRHLAEYSGLASGMDFTVFQDSQLRFQSSDLRWALKKSWDRFLKSFSPIASNGRTAPGLIEQPQGCGYAFMGIEIHKTPSNEAAQRGAHSFRFKVNSQQLQREEFPAIVETINLWLEDLSLSPDIQAIQKISVSSPYIEINFEIANQLIERSPLFEDSCEFLGQTVAEGWQSTLDLSKAFFGKPSHLHIQISSFPIIDVMLVT